MSRLLCILALLPLTLCAKVWCSMYALNDNAYTIVCQDDGESVVPGDQPEFNKPILSKSDCELLRDQVVNVVSSAVHFAQASIDGLLRIQEDVTLVNDLGAFRDFVLVNRAALESAGVYSDLLRYLDTLETDEQNLKNEVEGATYDFISTRDELRSLSHSAQNIQCPENQQCSSSGGGTPAACPCQSEFNDVLERLNSANNLLHSVSNYAYLISLRSQEISLHTSNTVQTVSNLLARLNIPDDRMWSEIGDIYSNYITNRNMISYQALELRNIFYQIEQLLRGDGSTTLNLSTEGVIALNQLLFDMSTFRLGQQGLDDFHKSVTFFSNTVHRLFIQFNDSIGTGRNQLYYPQSNVYEAWIYPAFTNKSLDARVRATYIALQRWGGVTNWFQRMELYQQAQLGWFDKVLTDDQIIQNQEFVNSDSGESTVESDLQNTTNDVSKVTSASSNLLSAVSASYNDVLSDFRSVEITASLPTQITLLPEIDMGFCSFPETVVDLSEIVPLIETTRRVSSLLWRVSFWGVVVLSVVSLGKLVVRLVLYVIHLVKGM